MSVFRSAMQSRSLAMVSVMEKGNYAAISTTDANAISGYYLCLLTSNAYTLQEPYTNKSERIAAGELVCNITWLNPVPHCRTMFSHGMKDEIHLQSVVRIQHVVDENVKFSYLTSSASLPKPMKCHLKSLMDKNTIIIDDCCHDEIVENIHARSHLDYDEYFYSSEDQMDSDNDSIFDI